MKVAVLGFGTVGFGVYEMLGKAKGLEQGPVLVRPGKNDMPFKVTSIEEIVNDPSVGAVAEVMGGVEPAFTYACAAMKAGKHFVTSNKALVAAKGTELNALAREQGVAFLFSAACGGAVPFLHNLALAKESDEILSLGGILNGTTNYMLDAMQRLHLDYADVLKDAQRLGYAEADPSADIDGIDVANKTIISACVAFDVDCVRDLPVTGIRTLTKTDLEYFAARGLTIKLFGRGVCKDGRYAVSVEPVAISTASLEAAVPSNFNLVSLEGFTVGPLKFYGQGAGSLPTGNAIVQDVIDAAAGRRQRYDFSRGCVYDPSLLTGDCVLRTSAKSAGWNAWAPGLWHLRNLTPPKARAIFEEALKEDPTSFMAALA
jgi:homoserine dehydrogenase